MRIRDGELAGVHLDAIAVAVDKLRQLVDNDDKPTPGVFLVRSSGPGYDVSVDGCALGMSCSWSDANKIAKRIARFRPLGVDERGYGSSKDKEGKGKEDEDDDKSNITYYVNGQFCDASGKVVAPSPGGGKFTIDSQTYTLVRIHEEAYMGTPSPGEDAQVWLLDVPVPRASPYGQEFEVRGHRWRVFGAYSDGRGREGAAVGVRLVTP